MTGFILPLQAPNTHTAADIDKVSRISQFHQNIFASYNLKWRQNILWVTPKANQSTLPSVPVQQLVDRLTHSPVRCVCVDAAMGETHIKTWSEACSQAGKPFHLRAPKGATQRTSTPQRLTAKPFFQKSLRWLGLPLPKAIAELATY